MLHFPSPVKLTGWNATGGLLGRKDERLFFSLPRSSFLHPPPPPPLSSSHDSSSLLSLLPSCLLVLFSCLLYVCLYATGFLRNRAPLSLMCWYGAVARPSAVDPRTVHQCLLTAISPRGHLYGHVTQQPSAISLLHCPRCELLHEQCCTI